VEEQQPQLFRQNYQYTFYVPFTHATTILSFQIIMSTNTQFTTQAGDAAATAAAAAATANTTGGPGSRTRLKHCPSES
jgi:hypothetical protein